MEVMAREGRMHPEKKPVAFMGSALEDLREFPQDARRAAGFQLDTVQHGEEPDDWKPMPQIGSGVCEIRVRDEAGIFRIMYVAKFPEAVYVLHVFQKKTQTMSPRDMDLASVRYRQMIAMRQQR